MNTSALDKATFKWHHSLEEWCTRVFGNEYCEVGDRFEFAPYDAHRLDRYVGVPVVLVVLTSATSDFHANFAEGLDLIRMSTNGFRVVLLTDEFESAALGRSDWATEQILPEQLWLERRESNWLETAAEQVIIAQRSFGASYVIAPTSIEHARDLLAVYARAYNAQPAVSGAAIELFDRHLPALEAEAHGYRGEWNARDYDVATSSGMRTFVSSMGDSRVEAELSLGQGHGVLIDFSGVTSQDVRERAVEAGWGTVVLSSATGRPEFLRGVALACADALRGYGPSAVVLAPGNNIANIAGFSGTLQLSDDKVSWSLDIPTLSQVVFTYERMRPVLFEVGRIFAGLLE